jgi:hypothetical protein
MLLLPAAAAPSPARNAPPSHSRGKSDRLHGVLAAIAIGAGTFLLTADRRSLRSPGQ